MDRGSLEWFDILARTLIWAAGVVLVLAIIGAVAVAGSDTSLPFSEAVEREGRGIAAIAAIGVGIASAGVLSGLGAILCLLVAERRERLAARPPDEPVGEGHERPTVRPADEPGGEGR